MSTTLAIVFPGQGSQAVGMLGELGAACPCVRDVFAQGSDAIGIDLWTLIQQGPKQTLNETRNTQPALLCAGVAVMRALQDYGLPDIAVMAGHSLGEYSALVGAGVLGLKDAVRLVAKRGEFMQAAVPQGVGAMAAILGLDDDAVRRVCDEAAGDLVVEAVNFNAPGQVVIAGHADAVSRAADLAKQAGARRALVLDVSVPSHCALMKPAAEQLADVIARVDFGAPQVPVLHNVTVAEARSPDDIRRLLLEQLSKPVRWVETVQAMTARGVDLVIEAGPGKVLTGLNKRIDKGLRTLPVFDPASLETAMETLHA
jgi:[acyl-carrier-protein] S-malonyltransferase